MKPAEVTDEDRMDAGFCCTMDVQDLAQFIANLKKRWNLTGELRGMSTAMGNDRPRNRARVTELNKEFYE